jgi:hypothetical protein
MRRVLFALVLMLAPSALAQSQEAPANPAAVNRAGASLSAIWRPAPEPLSAASIAAACVGAMDELNTAIAAIPASTRPDVVARVRSTTAIIISAWADRPGEAHIFAPQSLPWLTTGVARFDVLDEAGGFVGLQDAGGREVALQLGRAGRQAVLRVRPPEGGDPLNFVGCAATPRD